MKPGERQLPGPEAHARIPGWRGPGWLGALLLCVVLAATGMPTRGGAIADTTRIEACPGGAVRARPYAVVRLRSEVQPGTSVLAVALPRPQPRARTIEAGGLPPPRAPTA